MTEPTEHPSDDDAPALRKPGNAAEGDDGPSGGIGYTGAPVPETPDPGEPETAPGTPDIEESG